MEEHMNSYYVYQNWHRSRGRIHRADCSFCNHGKGFRAADTGQHGKWHGFDDREAAFDAAKRMGLEDMSACSVCAP
jgi:hypothetical protein